MFHVPNQFRLRGHPVLGTSDQVGNCGAFILKFKGYEIFCIASDKFGWEHVSVSIDRKRTPTWEVMAHAKDVFWDEEDTVFQFHPGKSQYVNFHPFTLHLWRSTDTEIKLPDPILVGPPPTFCSNHSEIPTGSNRK